MKKIIVQAAVLLCFLVVSISCTSGNTDQQKLLIKVGERIKERFDQDVINTQVFMRTKSMDSAHFYAGRMTAWADAWGEINKILNSLQNK